MTNQAAYLQSLCEILHVSVHRPRMTFKIKSARVSVGDVSVVGEHVATRPSWKLMPTDMESALDAVESDVGKLLDRYSVKFRSRTTGDEPGEERFQLKGICLVPHTVIDDLLGEIEKHSGELKSIVRSWTEDPGRLSVAVRAKVGPEIYELAKASIPRSDKLMNATGIDAVSIPIGSNLSSVESANTSEMLRQARQRTAEMVEQVTENLFAQPREELAIAVSNLRELILRDGRVTTKSVAPIKRALEKLRLFEFVSDDALKGEMRKLDTMLDGLTPAEQNSTTSQSNGLLDALRNVHSVAISEAAIADKVGQLRRRSLTL